MSRLTRARRWEAGQGGVRSAGTGPALLFAMNTHLNAVVCSLVLFTSLSAFAQRAPDAQISDHVVLPEAHVVGEAEAVDAPDTAAPVDDDALFLPEHRRRRETTGSSPQAAPAHRGFKWDTALVTGATTFLIGTVPFLGANPVALMFGASTAAHEYEGSPDAAYGAFFGVPIGLVINLGGLAVVPFVLGGLAYSMSLVVAGLSLPPLAASLAIGALAFSPLLATPVVFAVPPAFFAGLFSGLSPEPPHRPHLQRQAPLLKRLIAERAGDERQPAAPTR